VYREGIIETITTRRSIRRYRAEPVARDVIAGLLSAAVWAPSAHNRQPWRFCVVDTLERKEALAREMGARLHRDLERDGAPPELIEKDTSRSYTRITGAPVLIILCLSMVDMDTYADETRSRNEYIMAAQSVA